MDPELQALGIQLADTAVRNSAATIADRIMAAKARRKDQETIAELEEIIAGLVADKGELVQIAQAFESELVAQRIADSDVAYISATFVPLIQEFATRVAEQTGQDAEELEAMIELLKPILSVETVTVLQVLGFNFRRAIGEPLTDLVSQLIRSRGPRSQDQAHAIARLELEREVAYLELAKDPEAFARLQQFSGS